jgi:eukaryotic-like serine/threonine-protein kinase
MPVPSTVDDLLGFVRQSGVVDSERLGAYLAQLRAATIMPNEPEALARRLICDGMLTCFQAEQLLQGRWRGFTLGKYRILERLGAGGMSSVYLGEHLLMRRRVAIKVLPVALAEDPWFVQQFYHEARTIGALDHPNVVRAHDVDRERELHFLVLEYVDGASLQQIVSKQGPLAVSRAAHYIGQAALGLAYIHEAGLVHRDMKPGNLLLSRQGVIKILDMGLACFLRNGRRESTANPDAEKRTVGSGDYLAPEQILNSDEVDARADIYSLGATLYFLLTGKPPFPDASLDHHKLIWHLTRRPKPVRDIRPAVPLALAALVEKMTAKNPWDRHQSAGDVAAALAPWTEAPIPPPPESEMLRLSPAVCLASAGGASTSAAFGAPADESWVVYREP